MWSELWVTNLDIPELKPYLSPAEQVDTLYYSWGYMKQHTEERTEKEQHIPQTMQRIPQCLEECAMLQ